MLQLWTVGTHTISLPQTGLFPPIPTGRVDRPVKRTTATQWRIPTGKRNIGRDLTHTGLYVINSDHASSLTVIPDIHPENSFASTRRGGSITKLITGHSVQLPTRVADIQNSATGGEITEQAPIQDRMGSAITESSPVDESTEQCPIQDGEGSTETDFPPGGRPAVRPTMNEDPLRYEDPVMQISGTGHWFLEGWIGDHSIEFLVDSGSSVTAMSDLFYQTLVHAGAPLGTLQYTARTLRSANGMGIEVLGCSYCTVSFLGLQTEFPIIICNLATGTDAIIGTDVLGSVLPHTLDIKNGLLFAQGGVSLQLHRKDSALSGRVFTVGHSSIPPYSEAVLHCSVRTTGGRALPSSGLLEGLTLFTEDTGLTVGRTLVDPSKWKVPVLVSNFSQETIVVNPFTEVGMITQVTAMQSVADNGLQPQGATGALPRHLQYLVDQTETPAGGGLVGICRYISCTGRPSHRSHGCGGTRHQYGRPATHPVCTTPHVTPEDEKRGRMRH